MSVISRRKSQIHILEKVTVFQGSNDGRRGQEEETIEIETRCLAVLVQVETFPDGSLEVADS